VPQCEEVSRVLRECTGWEVAPVPALINFTDFFNLLANKRFPAASFIRTREEMEYLQEPDIFHEIFGHTPLLTDPRFAAFTHAYGKAGAAARKEDRPMLARLYWFTVEFGLIHRPRRGLRTYGAGVVSSIGETVYALDSEEPQRKPFDPMDVLRTPYRIDIFQPIYFVIESFDTLFEVAQMDLLALIEKARGSACIRRPSRRRKPRLPERHRPKTRRHEENPVTELTAMRCQPCEGGVRPMDRAEAKAMLARLQCRLGAQRRRHRDSPRLPLQGLQPHHGFRQRGGLDRQQRGPSPRPRGGLGPLPGALFHARHQGLVGERLHLRRQGRRAAARLSQAGARELELR
jgi:phenylalanine-4-hydroxylase